MKSRFRIILHKEIYGETETKRSARLKELELDLACARIMVKGRPISVSRLRAILSSGPDPDPAEYDALFRAFPSDALWEARLELPAHEADPPAPSPDLASMRPIHRRIALALHSVMDRNLPFTAQNLDRFMKPGIGTWSPGKSVNLLNGTLRFTPGAMIRIISRTGWLPDETIPSRPGSRSDKATVRNLLTAMGTFRHYPKRVSEVDYLLGSVQSGSGTSYNVSTLKRWMGAYLPIPAAVTGMIEKALNMRAGSLRSAKPYVRPFEIVPTVVAPAQPIKPKTRTRRGFGLSYEDLIEHLGPERVLDLKQWRVRFSFHDAVAVSRGIGVVEDWVVDAAIHKNASPVTRSSMASMLHAIAIENVAGDQSAADWLNNIMNHSGNPIRRRSGLEAVLNCTRHIPAQAAAYLKENAGITYLLVEQPVTDDSESRAYPSLQKSGPARDTSLPSTAMLMGLSAVLGLICDPNKKAAPKKDASGLAARAAATLSKKTGTPWTPGMINEWLDGRHLPSSLELALLSKLSGWTTAQIAADMAGAYPDVGKDMIQTSMRAIKSRYGSLVALRQAISEHNLPIVGMSARRNAILRMRLALYVRGVIPSVKSRPDEIRAALLYLIGFSVDPADAWVSSGTDIPDHISRKIAATCDIDHEWLIGNRAESCFFRSFFDADRP